MKHAHPYTQPFFSHTLLFFFLHTLFLDLSKSWMEKQVSVSVPSCLQRLFVGHASLYMKVSFMGSFASYHHLSGKDRITSYVGAPFKKNP